MLWRDVRQALRGLRLSPATATIAALTLGLGLGGNTAAYTWIDALLLRPYPFDDLGGLFTVWERHASGSGNLGHQGRATADRNPLAAADYLDLVRESSAFSRLAAYQYAELALSGDGEPERLRGVLATSDLLPVLGIEVAHGRAFSAEECEPGRGQVLLLSDAFWRRRFGADPAVLGREIRLDERVFTVIGVLPATLRYPLGGPEVWMPLAFDAALSTERKRLSLRAVGRLGEGVEIAAAQAELDAIAGRLEQTHPSTNEARGMVLAPLREQQIGLLPPFLFLFQGAAILVLLIACANTTSLLLARWSARQREVAMRVALGASRFRVARLVLLETLFVALVGGALAVALAWVGARLIRAGLPPSIAKWVGGWSEIGLEWRAVAMTGLASTVAALVAGIVPALRVSGIDPLGTIRDGGAAAAGWARRHRFAAALVVTQLALAVVLSLGSALLVQGFARLVDSYDTLEPPGVLSFAIRLPEPSYAAPSDVASFQERLVGELESLPGVDAAALVSHLPGDQGPIPSSPFFVEGADTTEPAELPSADLQVVSAGYFETLRIPLLEGRALRPADVAAGPRVVVVSDSTARRHFPGGDPLGRRLRLGASGAPGPWLTVVGVVADVRQYWFDATPRPTLYLPYQQAPRRATFAVLRTGGDPAALASPVRRRVLELDAQLPVDEVRTMEQVVDEAMAFLRTASRLLGALAALASVLAAVGIYGLLGHHVAQSRHEVGVRMALGADRREVLRLVIQRVVRLAALGLAVGLPAAFALARLLAGSLYGVVAAAPALVAVIGGSLGAVALAAGYLPARRATRLDPIVVLRGR